jgi:hypothetical protein
MRTGFLGKEIPDVCKRFLIGSKFPRKQEEQEKKIPE